jgi:anti-anti-sigma factor
MLSSFKVFTPSGIFGGFNSNPPLLQEATALMNESTKAILIDFSDVTFVDSMGLGILVRLLSRAQKAGCSLYLCSMSQNARMIMSLTGIEDKFSIYANREEVEQKVSNFLE